jgi:drug/metabolite transporter (DMT)-like permease
MPVRSAAPEVSSSAKLTIVLLALAWGLSWTATGYAVHRVSPWTVRCLSTGLAVVTLFAAARLGGQRMYVPPRERVHVIVAGLFNVAAFQILSSFSTLLGGASRAAIVTYSMPIWAGLLSAWLLHERLTPVLRLALLLCVAGLCILVWPLLAHGVPLSVLLALGCAFCWAFATVYLRWVRATVPPLATAAWQLVVGFVLITLATFWFDGVPRVSQIQADALFAIVFLGVIGTGLPHFLWWSIAAAVPPTTAAIGSLLVPVVGVIASVLLLGERLTPGDDIGFLLIFLSAACVLLRPGRQQHIRRVADTADLERKAQ